MPTKAMTTKPEPQQVAATPDNRAQAQPTRIPAVSVQDTDQAILLVADMPGVDQDSIEIVVNQDVLTLKGTVKPDVHDGFRPLYREYRPANFERSFTLPAEVDSTDVSAQVKNGVVTVTLPKAKEVQPRRISVRAG